MSALLDKINELSPELKQKIAGLTDIDSLKSFLHDHGIDLSGDEMNDALDFLKKGASKVMNSDTAEGAKKAIDDIGEHHKGHDIFHKILDKIKGKG